MEKEEEMKAADSSPGEEKVRCGRLLPLSSSACPRIKQGWRLKE